MVKPKVKQKQSQSQKEQKQSQSQKVVVNINTTKPRKGKRKKKIPKRESIRFSQPQYSNSLGYALNNQIYQIPQPKIMDYNLALAQADILREQQMKTGSLIPNQQINTLYTPNTEDPLRRISTNTQANMIDPTESSVEEVIEGITTDDVTKNALPDLVTEAPSDIVQQTMLKEMSNSLLGNRSKIDSYALGQRASEAISESLLKPANIENDLNEKILSSTLEKFSKPPISDIDFLAKGEKAYAQKAYADLGENLGEATLGLEPIKKKKKKKKKKLIDEYFYEPKPEYVNDLVSEIIEDKKKPGRPKGAKNKPKPLGEDIIISSNPIKI